MPSELPSWVPHVDYYCECAAGFSGFNCTETVCDSNPCQNGGTCAAGFFAVFPWLNFQGLEPPPTYTCSCPEGFTGRNCAEQPCNSQNNPCQNGATCSLEFEYARVAYNVALVRCECQPGFMGKNCEREDPCTNSDPCKHGQCAPSPSFDVGFRCFCDEGFTGSLCSEPQPVAPTSCNPNPCKNGGTCEIDHRTAKAKCTCAHGFADSDSLHGFCTKKLCDTNPCAVGQCSVLGLSEVCMSYGGDRREYDYCPAGFCLNGGTCGGAGNSAAGLWCQCPVGFSGVHCEHTMCDPNPCKNGGTCTPNQWGGSYKCACPSGWKADQDCMEAEAQDPVDCDVSPWQKEGICSTDCGFGLQTYMR
eukprot:35027_1